MSSVADTVIDDQNTGHFPCLDLPFGEYDALLARIIIPARMIMDEDVRNSRISDSGLAGIARMRICSYKAAGWSVFRSKIPILRFEQGAPGYLFFIDFH